MKRILILTALALALPGCTGMLLGNALNQGQSPTPEQIDAYNKVGSAVYGCFQIGGPPPAGNTIWVVSPKGEPAPVNFGDNCHIVPK